MPYIISQLISPDSPALWGEERAYEKKSLYKIRKNGLPPVNYDTHILNSHSLTHIEAQTHVEETHKSLDYYFSDPSYFYGGAVVVKLKGNHYKKLEKGSGYHWEVGKAELEDAMSFVLKGRTFPGKLLLTTENVIGYHDPDYVLTLSQEAADYLVGIENFNLYGTTWKSSDYCPGSSERPIHKTLFKKAVILECLDLSQVPEGIYFLNAFPLKIKGASESPVCPVLFSEEELFLKTPTLES